MTKKLNDTRKVILVVEDERALKYAISHKLESEEFDVVSARSTEEALDLIQNSVRIDGIWLDHYLFGDQSGLDLVTQLHKNKAWAKIPIFVVSNTVSPEKVDTYMALGIRKYYTKVDNRLDTIVEDIKKILGGHK